MLSYQDDTSLSHPPSETIISPDPGGAELVVSYGGTSQYNSDGTGASACGLAALNFARIAFSIEQSGWKDKTLLQAVLARPWAEETTAICALWSGNIPVEIEDICRFPLFEKTLKLKTTTYGHPGVSEFKSLLTELSNLDSSAVVIITHPPEIIACLKLRLTSRNVFIIFDSHPRPSYPNGAGMIVSPSIEGTARRLTELLPTVDLPNSFLQWQAQLLTNYSGHIFVPHGVETSTPTLLQAVLESSLPQLSMQAKISMLRSQNEFLKNLSEQQRLESEIKEAEVRSREQERLIRQQQQERQQQQQQQVKSSSGSQIDPPFAPPRQFSSLTRQSSTPSSSNVSSSTVNPFGLDSRSSGSSLSRALGHFGKPPTPPSKPPTPSSRSSRPPTPPPKTPLSDHVKSILEAMRLQNEFDKENRALTLQRADLAKSTQRLFECGICMEEMLDDSIARPDPCGHTFCRECLRGHVAARLNEHRFPILCPTCTAGKGKGKEAAGEVSQFLALSLGLTDEQYSIWTEMELASFSVLLNCRKCQRTMFVARDEHEEAKVITCPLPDCNHTWCKQCQQSINLKGPKHSCDGTLELDRLVKQQGWKYCPTCRTPIQKISGCNHMSCKTPACNTHFCYICGGLIVKSASGHKINEAASAHFRKNCVLFEVPA